MRPTCRYAVWCAWGSPLRGSAAARGLARRGGVWAMGRSAALLQQGFAQWDGAAETGQVAGCIPRGVGRWLAALDGDSDGTVAVGNPPAGAARPLRGAGQP